ncbi:hypothetical protein GIB67_037590 [Kingdonia uniflora]|uniref:RRM domain-containing protein n=1 Tax=Kingdonia uniflora TaxID=39325 RepID=A0A7J7LSK3_9MAGN|nr:hypothetical protein GIB67_037590 [Kingdonia uniflora]
MDSDQGKLFIGGISWDTSEENLATYFGKYGEVSHTVIMRDKTTGRPRGFGFVVFADPEILDAVLQETHTIDGRTVEAKRALSRDEQHSSSRAGNANTGRSFGGSGNQKTKKIFVGGLPPTLTEEGFREYFETYGQVTDVVVMYDQTTQRPRGFGFISFDTEEAVDLVLHKTFHELSGKLVEVKRALPKDGNSAGSGRSMGSGNYQGYGSSGVGANTYDGRTDAHSHIQSATTGGGFPPYGTSGYGAPAYGYGSANNGVGYGSYGGAPAGVYGNPNITNSGYISGTPGAPRSPWSGQALSGYGSATYGANMGYGNATAWGGAGSGAPSSAQTGQTPGGAGGYGNQSYGYGGGYGGGSDMSYPNQGSYGAVGWRVGGGAPSGTNASGGAGVVEQQGTNGGYAGSGYGDAHDTSGYLTAGGWRSDQSQGGQAGYSGGYGGAQSQQTQQQ